MQTIRESCIFGMTKPIDKLLYCKFRKDPRFSLIWITNKQPENINCSRHEKEIFTRNLTNEPSPCLNNKQSLNKINQ